MIFTEALLALQRKEKEVKKRRRHLNNQRDKWSLFHRGEIRLRNQREWNPLFGKINHQFNGS